MSIIGFDTAYLNNSKGNLFNLGKKDKINNLKINIIINNIAKIRGDNNSDFLNNEDNLQRGNKRGGKPYNKKTIIKIK